MKDQRPVAVIFNRLGPYHVSRLTAADLLLRCVAIELLTARDEYLWDKVNGEATFEHIRIAQENTNSTTTRCLSDRVANTLRVIKPAAVAIAGWSAKGSLACLEWCGKAGVPAVVMAESSHADFSRSAWKESIKRRIVALYSAALVGGHGHADYLARLGLPHDRIFLGYDAVDNNYFARQAESVRRQSHEVRQQSHLPNNFFLASARFIQKKNLSRLLEAYARYTATTPAHRQPWHLVLLGDGPLRQSLTALRARFGLDDSLHMPGFKQYSELPTYYALAGAFVHASTTEQWGLVVNEAMASGLPVLVSNRCGCAADLVPDGVNGFTFDPDNPDQLAQLLHRMTETPKQRLNEMGQASRRIIADWGPERFAQGLKAAVNSALQLGPRCPTLLQRSLLRLLLRS